MKKYRKTITFLLCTLLLLTGCGTNSPEENNTNPVPGQENNTSGERDSAPDEESTSTSATVPDHTEVFTDRDYRTDYDGADSTLIQLNGSKPLKKGDFSNRHKRK